MQTAVYRGPAKIDKEPEKIARMFNGIARRYDFLNHVLSAGLDARWRRRAAASLELTGGETVLDLCTGTADLAMTLMRSEPGARRVVGVDFARDMLLLGRDKLRQRALTPAIGLTSGDALHMPLRSASVDAATVAFGIRNVVNTTEAFLELARVIRPRGRLAILEFGAPTLPGVRGAYLWYFRQVLPRIGRLISGDNEAYSYLPASVGAFVPPEALASQIRDAGFENVRADPLSFGIVYLYSAVRRG